MAKRFIKWLIGICLLPACLGLSSAFFVLLTRLRLGRSQLFFLGGIAVYTGIQFFRQRPPRLTYVIGHETTHALAALLCGGHVKSIQAAEHGGAVRTTKTNTLISLAPYIVPFYALLLSGIFFLLRRLAPETTRFTDAFLFLLGASVAFHLFMTAHSLRIEQPDILAHGQLFSFSFIYAVNILCLAGVLCAVFPDGDFMQFLRLAGAHLRAMGAWASGLFAGGPS
ncbi:MAG: M50 family metallopeptidase [Candidatus Omnitrophica bacterium]|nr:M50 family metallopeptidase [Candidatus Omnitrophota bacterium]